jgi:hypothetical protein
MNVRQIQATSEILSQKTNNKIMDANDVFRKSKVTCRTNLNAK